MSIDVNKIYRMRFLLFFLLMIPLFIFSQENKLPNVFKTGQPDTLARQLTNEAIRAYERFEIKDVALWLSERHVLRSKIIKHAGIDFFPDLDLEFNESSRQQMNGYTVRNIRFQTRPGIFATASLYVPDGYGMFPAIITTHGHWDGGRRADLFQSIGHTLAQNGYTCLVMDAWGAGERTTEHEVHEYHGSNLGASLMNIGETLLGMQVTDNIRGVDLLSSFSFIDKDRIGATGASGGGNQSMWLAAIDQRIKAVVPVVSVGTFQSYILNSNCVCELLPSGLTFTEEAGVLGLIAPRALNIFNATEDRNPSFGTTEMLRSYKGSLLVFQHLGAEKQIKYTLFNTGHGYPQEMREAMVGWFNLQLKEEGDGSPEPEKRLKLLSQSSLATYEEGKRESEVATTMLYAKKQGKLLRSERMQLNFDPKLLRTELAALLKVSEMPELLNVTSNGNEDGWEKFVLEDSEGKHVPILYRPAKKGNQYTILFSGSGKDNIPASFIEKQIQGDDGVFLIDLWGTGEQKSSTAQEIDGRLPPLHTLSRSALWLGNTVMGEWVKDIYTTIKFARRLDSGMEIEIRGFEEAGIAAILYGALFAEAQKIVSINSPYSYLFDTREGVDYYNMGVHIPGFLVWGDLSLATSLSTSQVTFIYPRSFSGRQASAIQLKSIKAEYAHFEDLANKKVKTEFID